jgi:tRNA-Thr(GGU) m(6)t(6)A37 methyltransferase TsaA
MSNYSICAIGEINKSGGKTVLRIHDKYLEGLSKIEEFSHIICYFWFDRNDTPEGRATLKVHPRKDPDIPLHGVFATRSPLRPNLIGTSVCRIIAITDGLIEVDRTDALDGTPIIDIKPYIPQSDAVPDAVVPDWIHKPWPKNRIELRD